MRTSQDGLSPGNVNKDPLSFLPAIYESVDVALQTAVPNTVTYSFLPPRPETQRKRYDVEQGVHKIAVLRNNAIGDFIFTLPALEALRHAYPYAEIVLLGSDWHADFLCHRPGPVDRVEVIPPMKGFSLSPGQEINPTEVEAFFERMQAEEFDLAIQLHGGGKHSNPFVKRLGARLTVGARASDAIPLDRWIPYARYQMEILRQLEIVSLGGAEPVTLEPRLEVTTEDLNEANQLVPPSDAPLVVMHPGAADSRRRWPVEKFATVGDMLAQAGARIVVVGIPEELELAEGLVRSMNADAINLCGRTSLCGLTGLLSRAALVVSNDSGPLHVAAAVGTPTIGIYWVGNVINYGPVAQSCHRMVVSWRLDCPVCGLDCMHNECEHRESFVADVPQTEVADLALEMLELYRSRSSPCL
jgi:ADP-heptose:LPS heptosyltransferase